MIELFGAFLADYLTAQGLVIASGAAAGGKMALQRLIKRRHEEARAILLDALSKGKIKADDLTEDDAAAILFRYMRAAEEGAARLNLRLLSQVIVGQRSTPGFYANDFLQWADIVSTLKREEVLLLGVVHRKALDRGYEIPSTGEFWLECMNELEKEYGIKQKEADAYAASTMRTGLVVMLGGLFDMGHAYLPGPNLPMLAEMADFEALYMQAEKDEYPA